MIRPTIRQPFCRLVAMLLVGLACNQLVSQSVVGQDSPLPDTVAKLIAKKSEVLEMLNSNPNATDSNKIALCKEVVRIETKAIGLLETGSQAALEGLDETPASLLSKIQRATISNGAYLAELQEKTGQLEESVRSLEYAFANAEKAYGKSHWQTRDYARLLKHARWNHDASPEQREKWETVMASIRQGSEFFAKDDMAASLAVFKNIKESLEEIGMTETTQYTDSLVNTAVTLMNLRDYQASDSAFKDAIPVYKKLYGSDHPANGSLLTNYAQLYRNQGKNEEALNKLRSAAEFIKTAHGDQSEMLAQNHLIQGRVHHDMNNYEAATNEYQAAFMMLTTIGLQDSDLTLRVLGNQYELYKETSSNADAGIVADVGVRVSYKVYGVDSEQSASWLLKQAWIDRSLGNPEKALDALKLARAKFEKLEGHQKNEDYILTLANTSLTLLTLNQLPEAEVLGKKAVELSRDFAGEQSLFFATRAQNYGVTLFYLKRYDEAEKWLATAMPVLEKELGSEHPEFLNSLNDRARNSFANNKFDDAIKFWSKLEQSQMKTVGESDTLYQVTLQSLSEAYAKSGNKEKAQLLEKRIADLKAIASSTPVVDTISDANRFKQLALAIQNAESDLGGYPFPVPNGNSKLSWRVMLLPYLEQKSLQNQFKMNENWDSDNNVQLVDKMPSVFGPQGDRSDVVLVRTFDRPFKMRDITDGMTNTIMLIQSPNAGPWTQQDDLSIDEAIKLIRSLEPGQTLVAAYYDGRVDQLSGDLDETTLRSLLTPNGGEVIDESIAEKSPASKPSNSVAKSPDFENGRALSMSEQADLKASIDKMIGVFESGDVDKIFAEIAVPAEFAELKANANFEKIKTNFMANKVQSLLATLKSADLAKSVWFGEDVAYQSGEDKVLFTKVGNKWYLKN